MCPEDIGVQNISLRGFVLEHQWTVKGRPAGLGERFQPRRESDWQGI